MVVNTLTIRGRDQVMLKVTVAEISRDIAKQLGITTSSLTANWGTFTQYNPFAFNGPIAIAADGATTALTAQNPSNTLSATLQVFERYGVSHILAEPTVSAVSGESAKLTVGGEIPIPNAPTCAAATGSGAVSCTGGAVFKDYGVTLRFSPVVLSEGHILLHLATEVTEIDTQAATVFGTLVPGFLTRKNETTVAPRAVRSPPGPDDLVFSPRAFRDHHDARDHSDQPHGALRILVQERKSPGLSLIARFHCVRFANRSASKGTSNFLPLRTRARLLELALNTARMRTYILLLYSEGFKSWFRITCRRTRVYLAKLPIVPKCFT